MIRAERTFIRDLVSEKSPRWENVPRMSCPGRMRLSAGAQERLASSAASPIADAWCIAGRLEDSCMDRKPPWLELLDPTADVGLRVRAPALKTLFARAAWGMFFLLTDVRAVRPVDTRTVHVEADDRAALLVKWLSELNFIHQVDRRVFCRFAITEMSSRSLIAEVSGEPLTSATNVHMEIKAVTYHGLSVRRESGIWKAEVVFDV